MFWSLVQPLMWCMGPWAKSGEMRQLAYKCNIAGYAWGMIIALSGMNKPTLDNIWGLYSLCEGVGHVMWALWSSSLAGGRVMEGWGPYTVITVSNKNWYRTNACTSTQVHCRIASMLSQYLLQPNLHMDKTCLRRRTRAWKVKMWPNLLKGSYWIPWGICLHIVQELHHIGELYLYRTEQNNILTMDEFSSI